MLSLHASLMQQQITMDYSELAATLRSYDLNGKIPEVIPQRMQEANAKFPLRFRCTCSKGTEAAKCATFSLLSKAAMIRST